MPCVAAWGFRHLDPCRNGPSGKEEIFRRPVDTSPRTRSAQLALSVHLSRRDLQPSRRAPSLSYIHFSRPNSSGKPLTHFKTDRGKGNVKYPSERNTLPDSFYSVLPLVSQPKLHPSLITLPVPTLSLAPHLSSNITAHCITA